MTPATAAAVGAVHCLVHHPSSRSDAALHCVLVHDTFAPDADWVQPYSLLSRELASLDAGGVRFSKFLWSGENSQTERGNAAQALSEALTLEAASSPNTRFLLVGHSHGGNVIMNAVRGVPEEQRAGVVCLSSPFLHVRRRSTAMVGWVYWGLWMTLVSVVGSGFLMAFRALAEWLETGWVGRYHGWFYSVLAGSEPIARAFGAAKAILLFCFLGGLCAVLSAFGRRSPPLGQLRAAERWGHLVPQDTRTLCIWFSADEAYWGLRLVRLTGEWMAPLISGMARVGFPIICVSAAVVAARFACTAVINSPGALSQFRALTDVLRILRYVGPTMVVVPVALWGVARLIAPLAKLGVGSAQLTDHLWLDIHTERTPQIQSSLVERRRPILQDGGWLDNFLAAFSAFSGHLVHSRLYSDPRTPAVIADWYRGLTDDGLSILSNY
jgi:hypothetical protein